MPSRAGRSHVVGASVALAILLGLGGSAAPAAAAPPADTLAIAFFTDATLAHSGLVGSYVDSCLQAHAEVDDWRDTETIAGARVDSTINFRTLSWGHPADVGLTKGNSSDINWELFSVQWDGYVQVLADTRFSLESDDASRMWIDLDDDGTFTSLADEFVDNHWGQFQTITLSPESRTISPSVHRIRIQYYEQGGGNVMTLVARRLLLALGSFDGREFFLTSGGASIDSARTLAAEVGHRRSAPCFLATVGTADVHAWLDARVSNAGPAWIGLSDEVEEGVWRWDSGEEFSHAFWQRGEPNSGLNGNHVTTNGALDGGWIDFDGNPLLPAILEVRSGCPSPGAVLVAADAPNDDGHRIELDWSAYPGVPGAQYRVFRAHEPCLLFGDQSEPLGTTSTPRFLDATASDFEPLYYRVDVELAGRAIDTLVSGSAVAHPNLLIVRADLSAGTVEVRNLAPVPVNVDGYRVAALRRSNPFVEDVQVLGGAIAGGSKRTFDASGLLESEARLFLLPPARDFRIHTTVVGRVSASAQPNAFDGYQSGHPIRVNVSVPSFLGFLGGQLFVRRGGSRTVWADSLRRPLSGVVPTAVIPDSLIGPRGVEYWVAVNTDQGVYTDPPDLPAESPIRLRVRCPIAESAAAPGRAYRMASIPLEFDNESLELGDVVALRLGASDPRIWRVFGYSPSARSTLEWQPAAADSVFRAEPGRACWLITRDPYRIDTGQTLLGQSVETDGPFRIVLQPGWNQIGNPFAFPIAWDDVQLDANSVGPPMYYDTATKRYVDLGHGVLAPFSGVFLENLSPSGLPIEIAIPPLEAAPALTASTSSSSADHGGWRIHARLSDDAATFDEVELETAAGASADYDARDLRKPPVPPGSRISLAIDDGGFRHRPGLYQRDVRPVVASGHEWTLRAGGLRSDVPAALELSFTGERPADLHVGIIVNSDEFLEVLSPGAEHLPARVTLPGGSPTQTVRIVAGSAAYVAQSARALPVPARLALDSARPNPFARSTTVRFGLAQPERVSLAVYDPQGRRVRSLIDGESLPAGFHSRAWSGTDDRGGRVGAGLYIVRLQSPSGTQARKLILTR